MTVEGMNDNEVAKQVRALIEKHPDVVQTISAGTELHRCQLSKHDQEPRHYGHEDYRYTPQNTDEGVLYVGFSREVALAESFQPGQGVDNQAVALSKLQVRSLHRLETVRPLKVVDAVAVANRAAPEYHKLRDLVQAKGQGSVGYKRTQEIAAACMVLEDIDGMLYTSAVYSKTGSLDACNLALFEGRGTQVTPTDHQPIMEVELNSGETAVEFLGSLGVVLEVA